MTITAENIIFLGEIIAALGIVAGTITALFNYYKKPQKEIKDAICAINESLKQINKNIEKNQKDIEEMKHEIKDLKQTNRTFYYIINTFIDIVYKTNQSQEIQDIKEKLTKNLIEKATT